MIGFVGLPGFSRIIEMVAMETMHFHVAHTKIFRRASFRIQRIPLNNFGMNLKGPRVIGEIVRQLLP